VVETFRVGRHRYGRDEEQLPLRLRMALRPSRPCLPFFLPRSALLSLRQTAQTLLRIHTIQRAIRRTPSNSHSHKPLLLMSRLRPKRQEDLKNPKGRLPPKRWAKVDGTGGTGGGLRRMLPGGASCPRTLCGRSPSSSCSSATTTDSTLYCTSPST